MAKMGSEGVHPATRATHAMAWHGAFALGQTVNGLTRHPQPQCPMLSTMFFRGMAANKKSIRLGRSHLGVVLGDQLGGWLE